MKNIIAYSFILFFAGISLVSCLGDLDTMPLDDNQLVSEKVYQTKDGYTGVLAKCYASLVLTGQKGGDGGDGDLEGANEGYSGYVRLLFYLQELSADNFLMPSSSNGLRKCLNLQWDASNASVITWTYQRLYMSIAYCNELLRECTEGKLQGRGLWEEMKDDYVSYRAEARFIRAYCYSMLCDLFGAVPYVDENTGVKEIPVQYTRKQIFEFAESELLAIENELKAPGSNEYGRVDRVAGWFLLARMYLNAQTWINENKYQEAYAYAVKVIADAVLLGAGELHQGDAVPLALVGNLRVLCSRRIDEFIDRGLERVNLRRLVPTASDLFGHRTGHIQHQHDVEWLVRHDLARTRALRTGDVQRHRVRAVFIGGNGLLAGRSRQRRIIRHAVCSLGGKRSRRAGGRLLIGGLRLCRGGIPIVRHGGRAHTGDATEHRHGGNDRH